MEWLWPAALLAAVLIEFLLFRWWLSGVCVGTLRQDQSDPDEPPYLFLEMEKDGFAKIQKRKKVVMRVQIENYLSRNE